MDRITHLSPRQLALLQDYREKWIGIGLRTGPTDREATERGIAEAYRAAGLPRPRVLWCGSPLALALARALVLSRPSKAQMKRFEAGLRAAVETRNWNAFWGGVVETAWFCAETGPNLGDRIGTLPRDRVRADVTAAVDPALWEMVGGDLGAPVRARVRGGVWFPAGRAIWNSVRASVAADAWGGFRAAVRDAIPASLHGQHDANWLGVYDFFGEVFGMRAETRRLDGHTAVAQVAGWWLPHETVCWVSERPRSIALDAGGCLHSPTGPALTYPDGWSLYAWRGTPVPRAWIEHPESLTPKTALTHPNVEQRRAACELLGWETVLGRLDARRVQADEDPTIGELVEVEIPEIGRERFLRVTCGTGRRFALPVPPHVTTALEANAWTYGLGASSYKPEVRT